MILNHKCHKFQITEPASTAVPLFIAVNAGKGWKRIVKLKKVSYSESKEFCSALQRAKYLDGARIYCGRFLKGVYSNFLRLVGVALRWHSIP